MIKINWKLKLNFDHKNIRFVKNEPIDKHAEIPVNTVSENLSENKSINPNDKHAEMPVNNISENLFEHKSINPNDKFEEDYCYMKQSNLIKTILEGQEDEEKTRQ